MALNKAFLLFDANNSGDISEDEMVQIIRAAVDFKPDNDQLKEMMDKFRSNDTKRIEFKEFRCVESTATRSRAALPRPCRWRRLRPFGASCTFDSKSRLLIMLTPR